MARRYVPVAEVARPHGVRGELRLKLYNEGSGLIPSLVKRGRTPKPDVLLRMPSGEERAVELSSARDVNKAVLAEIAGVGDRDAAEALRGAVLLVPRDAFPALAAGEFYACDVEGARAMLAGEEIGRVTGIESYPTCDVIVIAKSAGGSIEVPLTEAYVGPIDVERGVVELVTIEGLA
jgi:16S rRNA processing protein RimM